MLSHQEEGSGFLLLAKETAKKSTEGGKGEKVRLGGGGGGEGEKELSGSLRSIRHLHYWT